MPSGILGMLALRSEAALVAPPMAASGLMKPVPNTLAEAPTPTRGHYEDMFGWAKNLFADSFS